jgi:RNA polymerase sigma-70 factor, ECF subfamily
VLGFSAKECAETLDTTIASVNSALQRARATIDDRLPERSQQETLRSLGDEALREIVDRYVEAWEKGDVETVVGMLAEDAVFAMPPLASWFGGREEIGDFLRYSPMSGDWDWRAVRTQANGQVALAFYSWDPEAGAYMPFALNVLTLRDREVAEVDAFIVRTPPDPDRETILRMPEYESDAQRLAAAFGNLGMPERLER